MVERSSVSETLADELRKHMGETLGLNGKIRIPIEFLMRCEAALRSHDHAQCQQQPIAWRWRIKNANGDASGWALQFHKPNISKDVLHDEEPLFALADTSTDRSGK